MVNKNRKIVIIGVLIGSAFLMLKGCQWKEQKLDAIDRNVSSLKDTEDILTKNVEDGNKELNVFIKKDSGKEGLIGNKELGITSSNVSEKGEITKGVVENVDIKGKVSKELEPTLTSREEKNIEEMVVDEVFLTESKEKDKEGVGEPLAKEKRGIKGLIFGMFNFNSKQSSKRLEPLEVPEEPIIIWKNGEDIKGVTYTLTEDITSEGVDGLKTIGGVVINEATITTGEKYYGIRVEAGTGINRGVIEGAGEGMYASDGGSVINEEGGVISNSGKYGMQASGINSTAINRGLITGSTIGMEVGSGTGINNKDILNTEIGMLAIDGGVVINDGTIEDSVVGMKSSGIVENPTNEVLVNKGTITGLSTATGMLVGSGTGINEGTISNDGIGMLATYDGTIINKDGGIIETKAGGIGMKGESGGIVLNEGTITGQGTAMRLAVRNNIGMKVKSGTGVNNKDILNIEIGMLAIDGGIAINEGRIEDSVVGMESSGTVENPTNEVLVNKGTITGLTTTIGMLVGSGTGINEGTISNDGIGMLATYDGTIINKDGGIIETKVGGVGMKGESGGIVLNEGSITGEGTAMHADGIGSTVKNNIGMTLSTAERGLLATDDGIAINEGRIEGSVVGMESSGTVEDPTNEVLVNKGTITGSTTGMKVGSGTGINNKDILNTEIGMLAIDGGIGINKDGGTIETKAGGIGMKGESGGIVLNEGTITGQGTAMRLAVRNNIGMKVKSGTGVNNKDILNIEIGMLATDGGIAINEGRIEDSVVGMESRGEGETFAGILINNGTITEVSRGMKSSGEGERFAEILINNGTIIEANRGMQVESGTGINNEKILNAEIGMLVKNGGIAINNKDILNTEIGMRAKDGGIAINEGRIEDSVVGMKSSGIVENSTNEVLVNKGTITGLSTVTGMLVESGTGINEGTISNNGIGMLATYDGTIINKDGGIIETKVGGVGMKGESGGIVLNEGSITGEGTAMHADGIGTTVKNNIGMTLSTAERGLLATDGGIAINEGRIEGSVVGMESNGTVENPTNEVLVNKGTITGLTTTIGMKVGSGTGINNKDILNTEIGMLAIDGGVAINDGTIEDSIVGMKSSGIVENPTNEVLVNKGTITGLSTATGMLVGSGTGINEGTISNDGIGMLATYDGTIINKDGGIIETKVGGVGMKGESGGIVLNEGSITGEGTAMHADGIGSTVKNNIGMTLSTAERGLLATDGGIAINEGRIEGSVVGMESSGTIENPTNEVLVNKGTITGLTTTIGMLVGSGTGINEGRIEGLVVGMESRGEGEISAGILINNGTITEVSRGMKSSGEGESFAEILINNGTIIEVARGMQVGSGTGINNEKILNAEIGMLVTDGGIAINNKDILNTDQGMRAKDGGIAINEGRIEDSVVGMKSSGIVENSTNEVLVNKGIITGLSTATGMLVESGTGINEGTISNDGIGMLVTYDGTIINKDGGIIETKVGGVGMKGESGGIVLNEGSITGEGTAMHADGIGSTVKNNKDILNTEIGMLAIDGGIAINDGRIEDSVVGMKSSGIVENPTNEVLVNKGTITGLTTTIGMLVESGTGINEGTISNDGIGMLATYDGTIINKDGGIIETKVGGVGMKGESGGIVLNEGSITGEGTAMHADGIGTTVKNNIGMTLSTAERGLLATDGGIAINEGRIEGSVVGMESSGTVENPTNEVLVNKGTITGLTTTTGMKAGSGTGINEGIISNDGIGMLAIDGGIIINKDGGTIETKVGGVGMKGESGGIVLNEGSITGEGTAMDADGVGSMAKNNIGMTLSTAERGLLATDGGIAINEGRIEGSVVGMESSGTVENPTNEVLVNKGTITGLTTTTGMKAGSGTGINEGIISNDGIGMLAIDGGIIINKDGGTIETKVGGVGMKGESGGIVLNEGSITGEGTAMDADGVGSMAKNNIGMTLSTAERGLLATDGGIAINEGRIEGSVVGMESNGTVENPTNEVLVNKGTITGLTTTIGMKVGSGTGINEGIISNDGTGMEVYSFGSWAINKGVISNTGSSGMLVRNGGQIFNEVGGKIKNDGDSGMYAIGLGSQGVNKGTISNTGNNGMTLIDGGKITNEEGGKIENGRDNGMFIFGSGEGINKGTISNVGSRGMFVFMGGKITNEEGGKIENSGNYGMTANASNSKIVSEGINKGSISNDGDYGMGAAYGGKVTNSIDGIIENNGNYRMEASNGSSEANESTEAINQGTLDTGFDNYIVMHGKGLGATITNEGTINVEHDGSTAMKVESRATAVNKGIINLNSTNGIGILVDGKGSTYDNDGGVINVGEGANNKAIHLTNDATFMNRGAMNVVGTLDFNDMGDGKFIMGDGGTLEAESLKGDFYASGALAMGSYEDEYSTYRMLKTDNIEGDIISNSYMFDAELSEQDKYGYYDIILIKKDFNTLLEDEKLGGILEDSYEDNGDKLKLNYYDALKLISSQERFEDAVESSYGMKFYPTIIKQNFDVVRTNNRVVSDNVLKLDNNLEIGEIVLIGGGNYDLLEEELDSGLKEYDLSLYSVYFGAEKQLNKDISLGGILTLGKMDAKYDESSYSRDGYQYQTNIYLSYENDEKLKLTSMLFGGMIDSNIERSLFFGSLYEKMEDSTKDYYVGLNNRLSKRYDIGKNYIEPALEFNITYMMQDDISESGDYGVEIDGVNSTSIETGLGITFGRDIFLENGNKINLETSAMGYIELGDPYKDLDSRFSVLSDEKVKIDGYEGSDYYGDLRIRGSYTTSKLFTLYAEGSYRIENNKDGWGGKVGFNFMF